MKERKQAYLNRCLWIISKHLRSGYARDSFLYRLSKDEQSRIGIERAIGAVSAVPLIEGSEVSGRQVRVWKVFDRETYNSLHRLYPQISKRGNYQLDRVVCFQLLMESTYYGRTPEGSDVFMYHLPVPGRYLVLFDWRDGKAPYIQLKGESVEIWVYDDLEELKSCYLDKIEVVEDVVTEDVGVQEQSAKPLKLLGEALHRGIQRIFKFTGR